MTTEVEVHNTKNNPVQRIFDFLVSKRFTDSSQAQSFLSELNSLVICALDCSKDPQLLNTLVDFGWNRSKNAFDDEIDIEGLCIALSSRSRRISTRASFVGSKVSTKSFLPEILVDCILGRSNYGVLNPLTFFIEAVCLIIDISGFTRMAGAFCAQGKEGIDGLQLVTNGFLGR